MSTRQLLTVAMAALSGIALAIVLLAHSLADIAAHPDLPGTRPDHRFATLVPVGIGSDFSDGGLIRYESVANWILPPDQPVTAIATHRRIARSSGVSEDVALGTFSGPMFEALGVRVVGLVPRQPDLHASLDGVRSDVPELVVSDQIAKRWFGSVDAALNQSVQVDSLLAAMGEDPIPFRISGVFDGTFSGPSTATKSDVWMPLSVWPEIIVPGHQSELLRTLPVPFVGALADDSTAALETRIRSRMADDLDGRTKRLLALPGLGLEGHSRLVYSRWAASLQWFSGALFVMLSAFALTLRSLDLSRRRSEDATRAAMGESARHWWQRQNRQSIRTIGVALSACFLVTFSILLLSDRITLPIANAIRNVPTHGGTWLLVLGFVLLVGWVPLAHHRLRHAETGTSERRLMRGARSMIAITLCVIAALAAAATASMLNLNRLADRDLGLSASQISVATRVKGTTEGRLPDSFDGRNAEPLLVQLADLHVAAASASPIDRVAIIQGSHRFDGMPAQFLFGVNFVSTNYFDVLGMRTDSRCGAFETFAANQALVNAAFLRQFRMDSSTTAPSLQLSAPGLNGDISLCGTVPDAQFDDVRSDLRPTIYLPLKRLGDLRALIVPATNELIRRDAIHAALKTYSPDIAFDLWQSLAERIDEQLSDERSLSRSGLAAFGFALVLGIAICAFAILAVSELLARSLAIRSAVGATRGRLLLLLFVPSGSAARVVLATLVALAIWLALQRFVLDATDLGIVILGAMIAAATCVAAGIAFVMRGITEDRLRGWLANRS